MSNAMDSFDAPSSTNTMNAQADSTSGLADHGASLKGVVDTLYGVIFHAHQEA